MIKPVASLDDILHRGDWCAQLQQAWYQHIPLSEKMGVRIQQYTGQKFITTMPEAVTRIRTIRCLPAACFRSPP
jgi:hypothetical protein